MSQTDASHMQDQVGTVVLETTVPIERGKIREFARAIHDPAGVYTDPNTAQEGGFADVPAPPTFTAVAAHYSERDGQPMSPARAAAEVVGLDIGRTVNGEQSWTYSRLPQVGDVLTGTSVITAIDTKVNKRGNELVFVTVTTEFRDQHGEPVLTDTVTIIQTAD
jgi:N-terminal half of MaoC dehydratase